MKEIKFRAYIRCGEWEEDGNNQKYKMCYDLAFEEYEPINDLLANVENLTWLTGCKDKNSKDIYKGDIIEVGTIEDFYIGEVVFCDETFCFKVIFEDGSSEMLCDVNNPLIRGNIYENPELLK